MYKYLFPLRFSTKAKSILAEVFFIVFFVVHSYAQSIPIGYVNYFSQKANNQLFVNTITSCTPQYWNISKDKTCTILYPAEKDSLTPGTLTLNTGVVKDMIFGEYIMEFEFYATNIPGLDSSGFCFIGPVKSADTYYAYVFGSDSLTFYFINKGNWGMHMLHTLN